MTTQDGLPAILTEPRVRRRNRISDAEATARDTARKASVADRLKGLGDGATALTGFEDEYTRDLVRAMSYLRHSGAPSLKPVLPLLLRLKGQPYCLDDYFPFEPFFRTRMTRRSVLKCGRQLSKSTSIAAKGITQSISIPHFSILYVTPLFEMIRRFSHQYVRQFIEESPVKRLFTGSNTMNSVLQRSFKNGSSMYFSFAFLDAERTRGIPAHMNAIDEVQDIAYDLLPIIHQTLGASTWNITSYSGTPKSLDNTMEQLWQDSSQAEFAIKCHHSGCGHWNIPSAMHDLIDMTGPWCREIGPDRPGVVCTMCAKPLNPLRCGRWIHAHPERRWSFPGWHIPQQIMPMHYANQEKWDDLVGKQQGKGNTTETIFLNEVCGESSDTGSKLVTLTDLKAAACLPWDNRWSQAVKHLKRYTLRVLAVDWGGGGGRVGTSKKDSDKRLRTSYTSLAVLGITPDGKVDCLWAHRSLKTHNYEYEARLCLDAMVKFKCRYLVHDYNGAGALREHIIIRAGLPFSSVLPVTYDPSAKHNFVNYHPATEDHPRSYYSVDRTRSLGTTCECIKYGLLRFFRYDHRSAEEPGLLHDFLALQEEKIDSRIGTDVFVITRNPNMPDDFAHAVNIGSSLLWHITKRYPDLAAAARYKLDTRMFEHLHPRKIDWDDIR